MGLVSHSDFAYKSAIANISPTRGSIMAKALTEKRVRDAKADPGRTTFEWDQRLAGFGVRTTRRGTKSFVLWTRDHGKKRLVTLGRADKISLDNARKAAVAELQNLEGGGADLLTRRAERKNEKTVADGVAWFLGTHVARRIGLEKMSSRTAVDYRQQANLYIVPSLGHLPIEAVQRAHVEKMLDRIGPTKPVQYARVRSLCRNIFFRFESEGWRTSPNPARHVVVPTERARTRILTDAEQASFLGALAKLGESAATAALRVLYLTGARLNEIRTLEWDFVDHDAKLLRLPRSKTGAKTIALTVESEEIIARCKRVHGNRFVFVGGRGGGDVPVGPRPIRRAFHEAARMAGLEDCRVHDLRRSAITDALVAGIPLTLVSKLVGHSTIRMTARYAEHDVGQVHEAAAQLAAARRAKRGATVIPLGARRA